MSAGLSREQALAESQKPLYEAVELIEDKAYIAKKLGLSSSDMDILIEVPTHDCSEYPNWDNRYKLMQSIRTLVEKLLRRNVKYYS